ncbi:glycosyl hydrolase family 43 protein [Pseudomassariella vexata]|uniref:Glycosyl hydrolase family 43 protein n=1 Tax=Pseudomassariella vexata TaxID=1141098 RepID=A0A1Y2DCG3_9PEZI|nr:glycosyl hydrolase family 43 protein [Pseudomassariella vexata]ORY56834.1 glycosyl hydrolase family 43 protein [Pseudomassariella vexata]
MFLFKLLIALLGFSGLFGSATAWVNPIRSPTGSDPFMVYSGGYYYLMTTTWTDVEVARSTTVAGLKTAARKVVYSTTTASRCCNVWAPEVHYLGGLWYIYYTAGEGDDLDGQRLHVLKGGATPYDTFTYAAQLTTEWAIDASILRFNTYGNYLMFSCFHGVTYQSICLQQLGSDYISLTGSISVISQPTESWEIVSYPVNEGPAALYFGGKTYISYSASYCWSPSYCLGLLTWDGSTAPTSASAWTKSSGCVLSSANGNYGTGHNSFFQSPDGSQTWIAYHATSNSAGACDDSRYTMVQLMGTHSDGSPNFGTPVALSHVYSEPSGE